jgi:PleD family two-component response regulator
VFLFAEEDNIGEKVGTIVQGFVGVVTVVPVGRTGTNLLIRENETVERDNAEPVENRTRQITASERENMHTESNYSDQRPLILVIEEEIEVLQNLVASLRTAGYDARSCSTADEAYAVSREVRPDIIICDVVVQSQGGAEICERIKNEAEPGDMPVMFLSGSQIPDIIRRRGPLGGSYYFRKPLDVTVLLDLLEKTLDSARQLAMTNG